MTIPAPWTVGRKVWSQSATTDAHGNPVQSHADAVPVAVHAVGPRLAQEPGDPNRWIVVEGLTVYAPAGTVIGAHDVVVWPFKVDDAGQVVVYGDEYDVDGDLADWARGPWANPAAGVTFNLTRSEG